MAYRTTVFWLFFVFVFWKFSNAAVPNWCNDSLAIEMNRTVCSQTDVIDSQSDDIVVYLCRIDMAEFYQEDDYLKLYKIWNPETEKTLFEFIIGDVTFNYMSGNTFWLKTRDNNVSPLKGRFQNFDDFKHFHSLVEGKNAKYSPQNFRIVGLESYTLNGYNDSISSDLIVLHPQPSIFSQYLIENSNEFKFVIEDAQGTYLTFEPFKYRSTRYQIKSQVLLTHSNDVNTYFIIGFDTPNNASSFARYIGKFAIPEPLLLPNVLKNFLIQRS